MGTKKILVTGGSGFVGTHLVRALSQKNIEVIVIDRNEPKRRFSNVQYVIEDMRNKTLLEALLNRTSCVYHLAATVSVPECENHPEESFQNNVVSTSTLLDAFRSVRSQAKLVFSSSAAVYGNQGEDGRAISEDVGFDCLSQYADHKKICEELIENFRINDKGRSVIFRFFNIYGHGQDPRSPYSGVVTRFIDLAYETSGYPVFGDGNQTRDFINIEDVVRALLLPLEVSEFNHSIYNVGSSQKVTINELAQLISQILHVKCQFEYSEPRKGDVLHSLADTTRIFEDFNWKTRISLEEGLSRLLNN